MNIGFVGLGKLGLPVALAIENRGYNILGYDPSERVHKVIETRKMDYIEIGAQPLLDKSKIQLTSLKDIVSRCDCIFVAVQTPHDPKYEGVEPVPHDRKDFDYTYLKKAIAGLVAASSYKSSDKTTNLIVISTVLPGTMRREILPLLEGTCFKLVYNPFFIAMGTTIKDFTGPEFVLLGSDDKIALSHVAHLYLDILGVGTKTHQTTIENAELIKVLYNTYISTKVAFANTVMEICHKTPNTNCDDVIDALSKANRRIISTAYLRGGMGDGGGCHPRDNIALSWYAGKINLSFDLFSAIMVGRDYQAQWIAQLAIDESRRNNLPIVLMGEAFKQGTNITTGSSARLVGCFIDRANLIYEFHDPHTGKTAVNAIYPAVFVITTRHDDWLQFMFPPQSVVIDPWRYLRDNWSIKSGAVTYVPIGGGNE